MSPTRSTDCGSPCFCMLGESETLCLPAHAHQYYFPPPSPPRIIHLFFSVLFTVFVLRHVEKRLGWFRTAFIYVLSGIGGNLVSAYFVPYNPEVITLTLR